MLDMAMFYASQLKIQYIIVMLFLSLAAVAQNDVKNDGIKFYQSLSWNQVKEKARKENKYIFVDCFATWCVPCKQMEKEVFSKKEVGDFFKEHFVSVRLQMDKTTQDSKDVLNWHLTADKFAKEYGISSFPTYLFFSPKGQIIYRDDGAKPADMFIKTAKDVLALEPGKTGPYITYYTVLAKYQRGIKDYSTMAGLADTASLLYQTEIADSIAKEYRTYLLSQPRSIWMNASNLSFMAKFMHGSKDPFFQLFYENRNKIDSILKQPGRAELVLDRIIRSEEIEPFIQLLTGAQSSNYVPKNENEPDWQDLVQRVAAKFDSAFAERNVWYVMVQWYADHHMWIQNAELFTRLMKKFPPRYFDDQLDNFINNSCWQAIFLRSVYKEHIDAAINCMENLLKEEAANGRKLVTLMDTYANLLYKAGKAKEAIKVETEVVELGAIYFKGYLETLDRMKQARPTWPHYISRRFSDGGLID